MSCQNAIIVFSMLVHKTLFVCFFSIISLGTDKIDKNYVRNIETKTLYDLSEKKEQCFTERTEALSELNILSQEFHYAWCV